MLVVVALLAFLAGAAVGGYTVARNTHRLVAMLPEPQRIAFAKKTRAAADRRAATADSRR